MFSLLVTTGMLCLLTRLEIQASCRIVVHLEDVPSSFGHDLCNFDQPETLAATGHMNFYSLIVGSRDLPVGQQLTAWGLWELCTFCPIQVAWKDQCQDAILPVE